MAGFVIDPEGVLRDPTVQAMDTLEWAAFSRLMLELWRQPEPGVVPDNDNALAGLARMSRDQWGAVRPAVERAFDTSSRPGFWVLRSMVEALDEQDEYVETKVRAGIKGAQVKAAKARNRKSRLGVKQSLSAAQPIVNPRIRESGYLGIRSQDHVPMHTEEGSEAGSAELESPEIQVARFGSVNVALGLRVIKAKP